MADATDVSTNGEARPLDVIFGDGFHVAMLMTMIGDQHTSRPVTCLEITAERISFLVDAGSDWVKAVEAGAAVMHVTIAEQTANTYVALNGTATLTSSLPEVERLWNPAAGIYFDGKDDPNIRVLHFELVDGQYWDGPSGRIGQGLAMIRAKLTGDPGATGSHGDVDV